MFINNVIVMTLLILAGTIALVFKMDKRIEMLDAKIEAIHFNLAEIKKEAF